jgi:hypothetical protein
MTETSPESGEKRLRRRGRPERFRIALWDDTAGSTPLELSRRSTLVPGLVLLAFFAVFAGIAGVSIWKMKSHAVRGVFDLMYVLFEGFWVLGWSVGVVILGLLTVVFLFYGESARLQNGRLVQVPRLGPLKFIVEYDLARITNLRVEPAKNGEDVRVRFDYGGGTNGLGDAMSPAEAEHLIERIAAAILPRASGDPLPEPAPAEAPPAELPANPPVSASAATPTSVVALVAANLVPLAGVLFYDWDVASVMVLYWAESAVVGFYTALKIVIVGKIGAVFAVPFFVGHFGGFMVIHFMFIYGMMVRGLEARGPEPGAFAALRDIFVPLWPALAVLFVSHAVSFAVNFIGRREHARETVNGLMTAPYRRIMLMQVTLIFGGWIVLLLKSPVPVLVLLIALKIVLDIRAHRRERAAR